MNSMIIQHNLNSMFADRQLGVTSITKRKSSEKLSSGYRINRAADDAAGLAISEKMRRDIRGLHQGTDNTNDGISWLKIGDGAMSEIDDMIHRMTELAVKAANGTLTDEDRSYIDQEVKQLKNEINRIGRTTTFNEIQIFDNDNPSLDVSGAPDDFMIFDASYDDSDGSFTFGGIVFHGNRYTWDSIAPDMVTVEDGVQKFKEGDYTFTPDGTSYTLTLHCEEGATVPDVTRKLDLSADASGITIDGEKFGWNNLLDEEDEPASASNIHEGGWHLDYHGADLSIYVPGDISSLSEFADVVNDFKTGRVKYSWQTEFVGNSSEQAVDAITVDNLRISQAMADFLKGNENLEMKVECDNNGIRIKNTDGSILTGSDKSWDDIVGDNPPWDSGDAISAKKTYTYYAGTDSSNPLLSFDFTLSDVTSVDSVIDGLNGMEFSNKGVRTYYSSSASVDTSGASNVMSMSGSAIRIGVAFSEEYRLGRDFNDKKGLEMSADVKYDNAGGNERASVTFSNNGDDVISLEGDLSSVRSRMNSDIDQYLTAVEKAKVKAVLAGKNPDSATPGTTDLKDIVGAGNITTTGYLSDTVTITDSMKKTDGAYGFPTGSVGVTYPTAAIDFSGLGSIMDLDGSGFDSTCRTCSNHYSIVFSSEIEGNNTTASGYKYSFQNQGQNYKLTVDLNSLAAKGVTASTIPDALIDILAVNMDGHYTQYAADGSKLYIFDDRDVNFSADPQNATFYTKPYLDISQDVFTVNMKNSSADSAKLNYTYDFSGAGAQVKAGMIEADDGQYYKKSDGSYITVSEVTDPDNADLDSLQKYNLQISYEKSDGSAANSRSDALKSAVDNALADMIQGTSISLESLDYSYINIGGNEKNNVAIRANFDSEIIIDAEEIGIKIQHSSNPGNYTTIPRFAMNATVLGVGAGSTATIDKALKLIHATAKALDYVAVKRATYGAYHNRFEHVIRNNMNTEENTQASESIIRDTDMAHEMLKLSRDKILEQAQQMILSQANQTRDGVLSLLG